MAYREHNRVVLLINRLKQFRRVATRYETLAVTSLAVVTIASLAVVTIAAILIWL